MDPEIKRLLEENHALIKDNHRMLRAVRRHQILATFGKFIVWGIVLLSAAYSYQFYLKPLADTYSAANNPSSPASGFWSTASAEIQKLLHSGKAGQ